MSIEKNVGFVDFINGTGEGVLPVDLKKCQ
jgi:hypothetical protein